MYIQSTAEHQGKPLVFVINVVGFFYVHYTTQRAYDFMSHSEDEAIIVECFA